MSEASDKLKTFEKICRTSVYSKKPTHSSTVELYDVPERLAFYLFRYEGRAYMEKFITKDNQRPDILDHQEAIDWAMNKALTKVPVFQRDNDKWTPEMQEGYIINLLKGLESPYLSFYTLVESKTDCLILDGLQRITALHRFFVIQDMKFSLGNGEFIEASEIINAGFDFYGMRNIAFQIKVFQFNSELEAVEWYIDTNRNITHSKKDIQRAEAYRDKLLAEMKDNEK